MLKENLNHTSHFTHHTSNKGITLIALIITIIVMLILVAVTINMAVNGGLFEKAEQAAGETKNEINKEKDLANGGINIGGTYYNSIDEYLNGGTTLISLYKSGKLKVGDYVGYNPSTASAVNPDDPEGTGTVAAGTLTGDTGATQSVEQEKLYWRVLGADGDNLLLISATPTTTENYGINFYGHVGYNNYENVLNTTCNKLYSNSSIGATARSITMNDIDTYLGGSAYDKTTFGGGSSSSGGYGYNNPSVPSVFKLDASGNLESESEFTDVSYKSTNMSGRIKTLTGNSKASLQLLFTMTYPFTLNLTSTAYEYIASNVITDATKLELLTGTNAPCPYYYWVASRSVDVRSRVAGWCVGYVREGYVSAGGGLCASGGGEIGDLLCVRPIVSLSSKVTTEQVPILETAPTITWDDPLGQYGGGNPM